MSIEAMGGRTGAFTPDFEFLRGEYDLGETTLPYFNVSLRVEDALKFIRLPRDVVFDPTQPIALEELFQRELDEDRVKSKLVPYLKATHKAKFFNSLTVALLPRDPESPSRFLPSYPPAQQVEEQDSFVVQQLGPVRIKSLTANRDIGYLSWDDREARAVVLDGQHRLFGLKLVVEDQKFRWREDLNQSRIPVIFLILHEALGYKAPEGAESRSLLAACRTIFIDLNKHSVKVSPDRQYLLDDLDIYAVSMRSIMSQEAGSGSYKDVESRVLESGRIPLALIDWYSGKAKFDRTSGSLHLTSTLVLYDHVVTALNLPTFVGADYAKSKRFVDGLISRLDLSARDPGLRESLERHFQECKDEEVPFALLESQVSQLGVHFRETVGEAIVRFLCGITPYKSLINAYEEAGLLRGELETWLALDRIGKSAFPVEEGQERPSTMAREAMELVKSQYPLAYQVVFQRAFIDVVLHLQDVRTDLVSELAWLPDADQFLEAVVSHFDEVVTPQLRSIDGGFSSVWIGAGLKVGRTIDFTKASQNAIGGLVACALLAPLPELQGLNDQDAGGWISSRIRRGRKESAVDALVSAWAKYWRNRLINVIKDEYLSQDIDPPEGEELEAEAFARMGSILKRFASSLS